MGGREVEGAGGREAGLAEAAVVPVVEALQKTDIFKLQEEQKNNTHNSFLQVSITVVISDMSNKYDHPSTRGRTINNRAFDHCRSVHVPHRHIRTHQSRPSLL